MPPKFPSGEVLTPPNLEALSTILMTLRKKTRMEAHVARFWGSLDRLIVDANMN